MCLTWSDTQIVGFLTRMLLYFCPIWELFLFLLTAKTVKELWTIRTFAYSDIIRTIAVVSDDLGQVGCTDFTTRHVSSNSPGNMIPITFAYIILWTYQYRTKIQNKIRLHYKIDRIHLIWNAICLSSFRYILAHLVLLISEYCQLFFLFAIMIWRGSYCCHCCPAVGKYTAHCVTMRLIHEPVQFGLSVVSIFLKTDNN